MSSNYPKTFALLLSLCITVLTNIAIAQEATDPTVAETKTDSQDKSQYPLGFKMKSLGGQHVDLADYQGAPLLIVNTASKCGHTPQYKQLQKLHEKYSDKGLRVLGFPCNQFRGQEPGDAAAISEFCQKNYGVTFDMFAKVDVKGDKQCDLYKYLSRQESSPKSAGNVSWNFEKFLLDADGKVVARYAPRVKPMSSKITQAIEELLGSDSMQPSESE